MRDLALDQIHVWQYAIDGEPAADRLASAMSLLNGAEGQRAAAFRFAQHRAEYVLSHAMLRLVLSEYAPVRPDQWNFSVGRWGKPEIAAPATTPPLWFNLSHTAGFGACVVGRVPRVGIDVESTGRAASCREVAEHSFAQAECDQLKGLPPALEREVFFRIWTLKEAYVKALGMGLSMPLDAFAFHLPETPGGLVRLELADRSDAGCWSFYELRPGAEHRMAVAVDGAGIGTPQVLDAALLFGRGE